MNLLSPEFIFLYNKIQLYCKNVFEIKVPLQWQEWLLSRKNCSHLLYNESTFERKGGITWHQERNVEWMQVNPAKSAELEFFFQLLQHTESVASCVAHNMLFHGGL